MLLEGLIDVDVEILSIPDLAKDIPPFCVGWVNPGRQLPSATVGQGTGLEG